MLIDSPRVYPGECPRSYQGGIPMYDQVAITMYASAKHNAVGAREDNDDSAFRRIAMYFVFNHENVTIATAQYDKYVDISNDAHELANAILGKPTSDNIGEIVAKYTTNNGGPNPNTISMANEFKILPTIARQLLKLFERDIRQISV